MNNKVKSFVLTILELSKVKITIAVAFTTISGYILARKELDAGFILPTAGLFLLACGSSVINHLQEYRTDAKMQRTQNRPIPAGRISAQGAGMLALIEISSGSLLLLYGANLAALVLGLVALIWYNIIYTNLKKVTAHAVVPGSLIGSIPPLVGWVSGGGSLMNPNAWVMAFFFFIWQVPHFYLLVMKYGKQYEAAGFPSLTQNYSITQIKRIIFSWTLATVLAAFLLPMTGLISSVIAFAALIISGIWLISVFVKLLRSDYELSPGKYFMRINYYVLSIIVILAIDHMLI
jgi:protoheme IX farnesyltransferase